MLFILGAILGPTGDFYHVITQTLGYPQNIFRFYLFGMPFWTPLLFGTATLTIGVSHVFADAWTTRWFGPPPKRRGVRNGYWTATGACGLFLLYIGSGFLPWPAGGIPDAILATGALSLWAWMDGSRRGLALGVMTSLIGTGVEAALVHSGAFYYFPHVSNLFGVPSWLPWLYLAASVAAANLARLFNPIEDDGRSTGERAA